MESPCGGLGTRKEFQGELERGGGSNWATLKWGPTWKIIAASKWLGSSHLQARNGHLEMKQPYLGDLPTMIIDHWK